MKTAKRIAAYQILIAIIAAVLWGLFDSPRAGMAALAGGCMSALLTLYAGVKTFATPAADAGRAVMNFYRAEVRKLILAAVLFAVAARFFSDVFAPIVITFALTLTVFWFALLWESSDG